MPSLEDRCEKCGKFADDIRLGVNAEWFCETCYLEEYEEELETQRQRDEASYWAMKEEDHREDEHEEMVLRNREN